jgi:glycosyltransferase involved in cell wall biosynthesis
MTVGFFSPMPPSRTGVADYSAALLAELRKLGDVKENDPRADVRLYHLGNNQLHRPIYRQALANPGVVVLHDAVLQHFLLGSLSEQEYIAEFVYNYGRWNEGLAERLWRNRARSGTDPVYFEYPMLRRVAERSRGVIVHNAAAVRMVSRHFPEARVWTIPHLHMPGPEPARYEVIRLREELGVGPVTCLLGVFGHLRESKRLTTVLRVFQELHGQGEPLALLIAGEFASSDLARAVAADLNAPGIHHVGYTPEREFLRYAHAVDVCINLRYPAAGETSGIAIRLMGIGKPVVVSGGEETADLPAGSVLPVEADLAEADMLACYLRWLARFPNDARAIGAIAQRHIAEFHSPERVAALYWQALAESRD